VFPVRYGLYLCVPYGSHSKQLFESSRTVGPERGNMAVGCKKLHTTHELRNYCSTRDIIAKTSSRG
jgi:hypothetical protein